MVMSGDEDQYRMLSEQGRTSGRSRSRSPPVRRNRGRSRSRSPIRPGATAGMKLRVYVRNLPYSTNWMDLKDMMKRCGTVKHAEIFTGADGRSKGCGVVEFTSSDDAARAIAELDGTELDGRELRLREDVMDDETYKKQVQNLKEKAHKLKEQQDNRGSSGLSASVGSTLGAAAQPMGLEGILARETAKQQMFNILAGKDSDQINSTVFVSNLDYDLSWQRLKDTFKRAGNCVRCDIPADQDGKSKGFGTVVFESPFEALTAIALYNGTSMGNMNRQLACRLDRYAPLALLLNALGVEYNKFSLAQLVQLQAQAIQSQTASAGALGGLSSSAGLAGFSGFSAQSSAASGINMNMLSQLLGARGMSSSSPSTGQISGSLNGGMSSNAPSSRLPSRVDDSQRDSGSRSRSSNDKTRSVFVRNLPYSATWQQLKDKFRDAGAVTHADVNKDDTGRSKGHGIVEFETREDALRAVSIMDGTQMDGRDIYVKLDGGM